MDNIIANKVALRYEALFIDIDSQQIKQHHEPTTSALTLVSRLSKFGYSVEQDLLQAFYWASTKQIEDVYVVMADVLRLKQNWASLVKGWGTPTQESLIDHFITYVANRFKGKIKLEGTTLPCGHFIPYGTFPLERYNGCPYCGTPFVASTFIYEGQGDKSKPLRLFTRVDLERELRTLLTSPTPLDATQADTVAQLLVLFDLPSDVSIGMKETLMLAIKALAAAGKGLQATRLFETPTDILRFIWYEHTGSARIIEPRTLIAHARGVNWYVSEGGNMANKAEQDKRNELKLKYNRAYCRLVATWMNAIPLSADKAAETMHAKRGMWVRIIRALRLAEYAQKQGFERLAQLLDVFYHQAYPSWLGMLDGARRANNAEQTLALLTQRPGLFARCLYSTMLRFGSEATLSAFQSVAHQLPSRLLLSLVNAAPTYFSKQSTRLARPITGVMHQLPPNAMLAQYDEAQLKQMVNCVNTLFKHTMHHRYAQQPHSVGGLIYIDPKLYQVPVGVGDRASTIQDTSCALPGTRFNVEGNAVRLFMQWGNDLHAQHLDMDLSAAIGFENGETAFCSYFNLICPGAKHSGDIQYIPELVGTAEYVELNLNELAEAGARYVTFSCNAYSCGTLSPNLMVGWMNSAHPMSVSDEDGVAYDPSCVQHMVRVDESNLSKGLVFGVLNVLRREIVWLEMPYTSQTILGVDAAKVEALLKQLEEKITIGELLELRAEAHGMTLTCDESLATERYDYRWALNVAQVSSLLLE